LIEPRVFDWDDALIEATLSDGLPRVRVYRPDHVAVVLGRGSRTEIEVNADAIEEDGVPLLKRRGGGCSVVLDTGNVIVSTTLPLSGFGGIPRAFSRISEWVIAALNRAGVKDVRHAGISDLALGDRKIGGACIYRTRDLLYYSTTLLFDPSLDLIERYVKHPPREPEYRAGRAHRAFLGSLLDCASLPDIRFFTEHIDHTLRDTLETLMALENAPNTTQEVLA
jgi:lipoate-protein ligase A